MFSEVIDLRLQSVELFLGRIVSGPLDVNFSEEAEVAVMATDCRSAAVSSAEKLITSRLRGVAMTDDDQTSAAAIAQDAPSTAPRVHVRSQWSVQDFPAHLEPGTDVEIKTTRRDGRIVLARWPAPNPIEGNLRVEGTCTAYLSRRLSPAVRGTLEALWAAPPGINNGESKDTGQDSPAFRDWVASSARDLHEDATAILRLVRWHSRKLSPAQPVLGALGAQFSLDGDLWVQLPVEISVSTSSQGFWPMSTRLIETVEASFARDEREPLSQELLREAWTLRSTNIVTAVVVIVMALELATKDFISRVVPNADWLAFNAPSPPVRDILTQYVPELIATTSGERVSLPSEWADVRSQRTWRMIRQQFSGGPD